MTGSFRPTLAVAEVLEIELQKMNSENIQQLNRITDADCSASSLHLQQTPCCANVVCQRCLKEKAANNFTDKRYKYLCNDCNRVKRNEAYKRIVNKPGFHKKRKEQCRKYREKYKEEIKGKNKIYNDTHKEERKIRDSIEFKVEKLIKKQKKEESKPYEFVKYKF